MSGVFGSMTKGALLKLSEIGYPFVAWENLMERLGGPSHGFYKGLMDDYLDMAENYVLSLSGEASERTEYYAGRCTGDVLFGMMGAAEIVYGGARIYGGFQGIGIGIAGGGNAIVVSAGVAEVVKGIAIAADGTLTVTQGLHMLEGDMDRLEESKGKVEEKTNKIPDNDSIIGHIFRNAEGHFLDMPENRALLENVANSKENFHGVDKYGNEWYSEILENRLSES